MKEPQDNPSPHHIELESLSLKPVNKFERSSRSSFAQEHTLVDGSAIPEKPAHLCPTCDYNLTGLTSRRCPECGEPFTTLDARMHAIELSEGVRAIINAERMEQIKMYVGTAFLGFSVWLQNFSTKSAAGWMGTRLSFRGTLMLIFMFPLGIGAAAYKASGDRTWPEAIWLAGLVAVGLSIFMATI